MSEDVRDDAAAREGVDFIRTKIMADNASLRFDGKVHTRFPPEPNGYLHLGHAKSICLNFGVAREFGGLCNLRFDDTNPTKEEVEYVESIKEDVRWLGGDWEDREFYASNYFERLYQYAEELIRRGKAYVDDLSADQIREYRGTLTEPGRESPWRNRSVEENLDLFRRMRAGEFEDGAKVLRAKIDMAAPNVVMRDPTIYRIRHASHHRTGDAWCIYPMYDFTHPLSDSIEGITHSLCTLEFVNNREFYNWILEALEIYHPEQTEFARLNLTHTILSKRTLIPLVQRGAVSGWDDPRLPTLCGLRRRGVPPQALHEFCRRIGVAKSDSVVDYGLLEFCVREWLNAHTARWMAVLDPVRLVVDDWEEGREEVFDMPLHPEDPSYGSREVRFGRELYIEREDFRLDPPPKYHRLAPGREVRLRYAFLVTCVGVDLNPDGSVNTVHCVHDPASRGGTSPDGRKVKGTLHWVSAARSLPARARLYEHLFAMDDPGEVPEGKTFLDMVNPASLKEVEMRMEEGLSSVGPGETVQFERVGYFCRDREDAGGLPVFNRTATLRDSWAKLERRKG